MTTYTLPVSDALAARLTTLLQDAPAEQVEAAAEAFADALEAERIPTFPQPLHVDDLEHLPPGDVDAIQEGLDEADAKKTIPGKAAFALLHRSTRRK